MKTSVFRKDKKGFIIYMGLRNVTIDICRALKGRVQSVLFDIMLADVKKYSNALHPCPFAVRLLLFFGMNCENFWCQNCIYSIMIEKWPFAISKTNDLNYSP